jgi:excisionase family DNA binding protein
MGKGSDLRVNGGGQPLTGQEQLTKDTIVMNSPGLPKSTLAASVRNTRRAPQPLPSFYTIGQVAEALGVSTRTIRRWIAKGALAVHRLDGVVRIADRDLFAFLAVHREG